MGKLVAVAQSLLDILKWLMEGSNWIFVLPLLLISLVIMFRMVRKKETFLIFIWYAASVGVATLMVELALGSWEACVFALFFAVLYLIIYIPYMKRKSRIGRKGRHTTTFSSTDSLEQSRRTRRRR